MVRNETHFGTRQESSAEMIGCQETSLNIEKLFPKTALICFSTRIALAIGHIICGIEQFAHSEKSCRMRPQTRVLKFPQKILAIF